MTIKEARTAAGLSQGDASKLLGMPKRTLEGWEEGKRQPTEWVEKLVVDELSKYSPKPESNDGSKMTIKEARVAVKLTQEQVANALSVPLKTLRNWEQNFRKPAPWIEKLLIERILTLEFLSGEGLNALRGGELTWSEAAAMHKYNQVRKLSKIGSLVDTFRANFDRVPEGIFEKLEAKDIAAIVDALRDSYNAGVACGAGAQLSKKIMSLD